jgi:tRNA(Ile)-lysidine synthase
LIRTGDKLILAVSGGYDSTAMLKCLAQLQSDLSITIAVATLDHGLREDSAEDARWVEGLCQELKLPCHSDRRVVKPAANQSLEDAARILRYQFLAELARTEKATKIATAHHAGDQVETLLWRWITGAPWTSLTGIPVRRSLDEDCGAELIRPLLSCARAEIEAYVSACHLCPRQDSSNKNLAFLRNRLRLEVLPLLRQLNPQLDRALLAQMEDFQHHKTLLNALANEALSHCDIKDSADALTLPLADLQTQHRPVLGTFLRRVLIERRISPVKQSHIRDLCQLICHPKPNAHVRLSKGFDAFVKHDHLIIRSHGPQGRRARGKKTAPEEHPPVTLLFDQNTHFQGLSFTLRTFTRSPGCPLRPPIPDPPLELVWLDGKIVGRDLMVRCRLPGDKIRPLGMKAGRQTLKKLFQSRSIPADRRSKIPVITCDDQIIWVVGVEIDDRFKIEESCQLVVEIKVEALDDSGEPDDGFCPQFGQ